MHIRVQTYSTLELSTSIGSQNLISSIIPLEQATMGSEATETVILSIMEAGVAVLEFNRPLKRNALSQDLIDELTGALSLLDQDSRVRAVVLAGVGQSPFCGGWQYRFRIQFAEADM